MQHVEFEAHEMIAQSRAALEAEAEELLKARVDEAHKMFEKEQAQQAQRAQRDLDAMVQQFYERERDQAWQENAAEAHLEENKRVALLTNSLVPNTCMKNVIRCRKTKSCGCGLLWMSGRRSMLGLKSIPERL